MFGFLEAFLDNPKYLQLLQNPYLYETRGSWDRVQMTLVHFSSVFFLLFIKVTMQREVSFHREQEMHLVASSLDRSGNIRVKNFNKYFKTSNDEAIEEMVINVKLS
jgi:uncharacterized protein involved in tellurium resistance